MQEGNPSHWSELVQAHKIQQDGQQKTAQATNGGCHWLALAPSEENLILFPSFKAEIVWSDLSADIQKQFGHVASKIV